MVLVERRRMATKNRLFEPCCSISQAARLDVVSGAVSPGPGGLGRVERARKCEVPSLC
jgi:hypothetical protein